MDNDKGETNMLENKKKERDRTRNSAKGKLRSWEESQRETEERNKKNGEKQMKSE